MRAIGYFRETKERSLAGQSEAFLAFCKKNGFEAAATFLDRDVDQRVIDGAVNGTAHLVRRAAEGLRHAQDGLVRRYAIGIALGAAALLLFFLAYAGR